MKGSRNLNQQGRDRRGTVDSYQQKSKIDYVARPKTTAPTAKKSANHLGSSKQVEKPRTEHKKEKRQNCDVKDDQPELKFQKFSPKDIKCQRQLQRMKELFENIGPSQAHQTRQTPHTHKKKGAYTLEPISEDFSNFEPIPTHSYHLTSNQKFIEDLAQSQHETVDDEGTDYDYGTVTDEDELERINDSILDMSISKHQFKQDIKKMKKRESIMIKKRESKENPSANPSQNYSCAAGDHHGSRIISKNSEIGKFRAAKDQCFQEIGVKMKRIQQIDDCLYSLYENFDKIKR